MPASIIIGISGKCDLKAFNPKILFNPCPDPIGDPHGIKTLHPDFNNLSATTRSSVV